VCMTLSAFPMAPPAAGQYAQSTVSQLQRLFHPHKRRARTARVMAVMATATGLAALGAAMLLGQLQQHAGPAHWSFLQGG
jgi:hypothetical protein